MPCRNEESEFNRYQNEEQIRAPLKREVSKLSAYLCSAMRFLERNQRVSAFKEFHDAKESGVSFADLEGWWKMHKKEDDERIKNEVVTLQKQLEEHTKSSEEILARLKKLGKQPKKKDA